MGTKGGSKTDYLDEQLGELKDKVSINKYESAESANDWWSSKGYDKPPYTPKTVVQDIKGLTPPRYRKNLHYLRHQNTSVSGVLKHVNKSETQVANAKNISKEALIDFVDNGSLVDIPNQGYIKNIYVQTANGWVLIN